MSLFDILKNADLGSMLNTIAGQAKGMAGNLQRSAPGGMGGLLGAGALGAVLGNIMSSDVVKGVAMAGAGAMAWNFYRKWAAQNQGGQAQGAPNAASIGQGPTEHEVFPFPQSEPARTAPVDPIGELVIRAMTYAAKADGTIDATERQRMQQVIGNLLPGQNVDAVIDSISKETLDPKKIASEVSSPEQAEDVFRLSCAAIDVDHFMETSYLDALAKALGISDAKKQELEREADMARRQLMAAIPA